MPTQPKIIYVETFEVKSVCRYERSERGRRYDTFQMWFPKFSEISFDSRGEFFFDHVHYMDFKGFVSPVMRVFEDQVIIVLGHKDGSTYEVYITAKMEKVRKLRSPKRKVA